jgi:DNA-binding LytR/AlgR family response regulator
MTDGLDKKSDGRCLLLVEDEYIIADELALSLEQLGFEIVGPAGSVQEALDLVRRNGERLDGAVLDINLRGERAYPIADALSHLGVPFVFTTGYDTQVIPAPYATVPRCEKPVNLAQLSRWLSKTAPAKEEQTR